MANDSSRTMGVEMSARPQKSCTSDGTSYSVHMTLDVQSGLVASSAL